MQINKIQPNLAFNAKVNTVNHLEDTIVDFASELEKRISNGKIDAYLNEYISSKGIMLQMGLYGGNFDRVYSTPLKEAKLQGLCS